jgi:hypothetical protein
MPDPPASRPARSRWTSFVADASATPARMLHEAGRPEHRLRVEHDAHTLLIHLSDEEGDGWTVIAVERASRRTAVAQGRTQADTAQRAYRELYPS